MKLTLGVGVRVEEAARETSPMLLAGASAGDQGSATMGTLRGPLLPATLAAPCQGTLGWATRDTALTLRSQWPWSICLTVTHRISTFPATVASLRPQETAALLGAVQHFSGSEHRPQGHEVWPPNLVPQAPHSPGAPGHHPSSGVVASC